MNRLESERLAKFLSIIAAVILILVPFHAFLTVWLNSWLRHYILLRLWDEVLLAVLTAGTLYLLIVKPKLRQKLLADNLVRTVGAYLAASVIWGVVAYAAHGVTVKSLGYGLVVNLRFLVFFLAVVVTSGLSPQLKRWWPKLLLAPAAIVAGFGLLQRLVLPYDFLKHFGYGVNTIYPYETINHNIHYPRIMSTLRGANPLGAYLIVVLSALGQLWIKAKKYRWPLGAIFVAALAAMVFSYSRGAWVGLVAGWLVLAWLAITNDKLRKKLVAVLGLIAVAATLLLVGLRHNATFQNIIFHTQNGSVVKVSSNAGHASAFRSGVHDVLHQPLGRGVGTAGPASVYNNGQQRIAENYYLQIGQEVGWLGLALFLTINFLVAKKLYQTRNQNLAKVLLASLIGLAIVNLVSHAWTDDTLAYIWWGLAGIALAPAILGVEKQTK